MLKKLPKIRQKKIWRVLLVLVVMIGGVFLYKKRIVQASQSLAKSSQTDLVAGRYEYGEIDVGSTTGEIKLQRNLGAWDVGSSDDPADMNLYSYTLSPMVKVGRFIYMLRNRVTGLFMRYDLDSREWKEMAFLPNSVYEVADLTTNGTDKIYAFATRYSAGPPSLMYKHFLEYDVASDSWSYLPEPPADLRAYASLAYVDGVDDQVFAIQGNGTYGFWKYSVGQSVWTSIANTTYYCQTYCNMEYDGSQYLYIATAWQSPDRVYRYNVGATSWSYFSMPANGSVQTATSMAVLDDKLVTLRGAGTTQVYVVDTGTTSVTTYGNVPGSTSYGSMVAIPEDDRILVYGGMTGFWYYYPASNSWSQSMGGPPVYSNEGGQVIANDGAGNFYWCRASNTNTCYKYTIGVGWTQIANAPNTLYNGTSMVYANDRVYALRGSSGSEVYVYNPSTNGWTTGTSSPSTFRVGSAAVNIGNTIYALRGSSSTFWKYSIGGTWSALPSLPNSTSYGAGLVGVGNTLFALSGSMRGDLYRYSIGDTAWTRMRSLPVGSYVGGGMTYDGSDTIYALVGGSVETYSRRFYKYTISTDNWERVIDTPEMMNVGSFITWYDGSAYVLQGNYSYGFWKYTPPEVGADEYVTSGTWFSPVYDLEYVDSWSSFSKSVTTPIGTGVSFYSRSSDTGNLWDSWTYIDNTDIESTAKRYLQIKANLYGNGTTSPSISSFSVEYEGDSQNPNIVGLGVTGFSSLGGTVLTSGSTYPHTNPYFEWSGAVDNESGIEGYYVYFGSNNSADPVTEGSYQLTTNYTVGTTMSSGNNYYLLVKVKDVADNISEAKNLFTYGYSGISPGSEIDISSQEEIELGSLESIEASSSAWWNTGFLYRRQLTVVNNSGENLVKGDFAKVEGVGTSSLLADSKIQSDGDDLRVVYWDGVDWLDVERGWESLDSDNSTIYLKLANTITTGNSDNNYYLYYGNGNAIGPAPLTVFYDNFNDNDLDTSKWTLSSGYGSVSENNNRLEYTGRTSGNSGISSQLRSGVGVTGDFTAEFEVYAENNQGSSFYGGLFFGSYDDSTPNNAAGALVMLHYNGNSYAYSKSAGSSWSNLNLQIGYTKAQWYNFRVVRQGSNWYFYRDGVVMGSGINMYTGPVDVVTMRYWQESVTTNSQGDLYWDNIGINSYVNSGVGVTLGNETGVLGSNQAEIKLVHEKNGQWAGYQVPPLPRDLRNVLGPSVVAKGYLYVTRGYGSNAFYRLNLSTGVGETLINTPIGIGHTSYVYGATMVFDGNDAIYVTAGGRLTDFYKYTISSQTWSNEINQPGGEFYNGAVGTKAGDYIYYFRGNSTADFYRYNIVEDEWETLALAPWNTTAGSGLAYDGNDTIYAVFGANTLFAKYTISTDDWSVGTLPQIPHYEGSSINNLIYRDGEVYTFSYYDHGLTAEQKRYVWKYTVASNRWDSVDVGSEVPWYTGSVAYDGDRYVYLVLGYNGSASGVRPVYRFDLVSKKYLPETPPVPFGRNLANGDGQITVFNPYQNTSLVSDEVDSVFYLYGNGSYFNEYKITDKEWKVMPPIPCTYRGGAVAEGDYVYVACGDTTTSFFRFNKITDEWQQRAPTLDTINVYGGNYMTKDGSGNLYLIRGVGSTTMYKYNVNSDSWSIESNSVPVSIGSGSVGVSLIGDGSTNLYLIRGANTTDFYKYSLTTQTWQRLSNLPVRSNASSGSIYNDGKIFVIAGDRTTGFYIYDVASDSWETSMSMLTETYYGSTITKGPGNTAYSMVGDYDWTFSKFNLPSSTTAYNYQGTFISRAYDMGTPYRVVAVEAQVSSPSATNVTFETRTSTDSASWSNWQTATFLKNISGGTYTYNVNSEVNKYIQLKLTLESDESVSTPRVSGIKIKYYGDESAPILTETIDGYKTATKSAELVSGDWSNAANPYFEWGVADDGTGSGIAGYLVKVGLGDSGEGGTWNSVIGETMTVGLTTDGNYYMQIKAIDNVGNTSPSWLAFNYKYDGTPPLAPSSVAVDPRNYTSLNSFKFFWPTTVDGGEVGNNSGMRDYVYKTGASTGTYSSDQYIIGTEITGITAYQDGANTFYVKSRDWAGNESSYKTTAYYYNGSAPSMPINLSVGVSYNTENSFSFDWDTPEEYQGSISEYRYSVNTPPSESNYSTVLNSYLPAGAYATIKGSNILYVVAVDEAGNVNYNSYASVEFYADTSAPGIPLNVEAFDNSIRATEQYKLGLTWDPPSSLGTGFAGYAVFVSKTSTSCTTDLDGFTKVGTTGGTTYVVADIGGTALESVRYYACVKAYDSTNQYSAPSSTTSLIPTGKWLTAPDLETAPASTVKTKSAVITWTTSRDSNSFVKYGTSTGSYGNEVGSSEQEISHSISINNLEPGTTYYYKVLWTDEDGNQGSSNEYSFTTNPAPFVSDVEVKSIGLYQAYVSFTIKGSSSINLEYGETINYGSVKTMSTSMIESSYMVLLDSLDEGTEYHFRVKAKDEEGNEYSGDDYSFETLPVPKITGVKIQQVVGMPSATLRFVWESNTEISSMITYYPVGMSERSLDQIDLALHTKHEMVIRDLMDETEYVIVIKGKDVAGNEAVVEEKTVKTATDLRAPEVSDVNIESTITGVGEEAKAQVIISWNTDEPSTTQVEYGEGTGSEYVLKTQEDASMVKNHVVTIPDLKPANIYHLRVVSTDKAGNVGTSFDSVVITPKATKSALNLVIESLSKTFGFLGK